MYVFIFYSMILVFVPVRRFCRLQMPHLGLPAFSAHAEALDLQLLLFCHCSLEIGHKNKNRRKAMMRPRFQCIPFCTDLIGVLFPVCNCWFKRWLYPVVGTMCKQCEILFCFSITRLRYNMVQIRLLLPTVSSGFDRPIYWLIDWFIDRLIDWLSYWLINWYHLHMEVVACAISPKLHVHLH